MHDYQRDFIELTLQRDVLRFGEFTLKSGRLSPYFFNMGRIDSGAALARLGRAYAAAVVNSGLEVDMLFGPAYKGIALAAATAMALADQHDRDLPWAYNRKEAKDHGEGGHIVGAALKGRVVIVDDVISDGAAKREAIDLIQKAGATPAAMLLALDRQERGQADRSAVQEIYAAHGVRCVSILTLGQLLAALEDPPDGRTRISAQQLTALKAYRAQFGVP